MVYVQSWSLRNFFILLAGLFIGGGGKKATTQFMIWSYSVTPRPRRHELGIKIYEYTCIENSSIFLKISNNNK